MMRKMISVSLISIMCLAVTACGGGNTNGNTAGTTAPTSTPAASAPASKEPVKNEKLIVYTNANSDGRGDWLVQKAKDAGFEIEIVGAGGANLTNRLIAEKNNPVADVIYGLNNMLYENLKKEKVLAKYAPAWAGEIEAGLNDTEGYYHGLVKQAILIGYNPKTYTADTAPKDWSDVYSNPQFKGKYETPTQLDQITPQLIVASILTKFKDDKGEYGISKQGWDEIKKLYDNGVPAVKGEDFYQNMVNGKSPIGAVVSGTLQAKEKQYGVKAGIVSPSSGVPMIVEQAAIANGTKKMETAKRFIDWIGSADLQGQFAAQFNAMPANTKAVAKANKDVQALYASIKPIAFDWVFVAGNLGKWVEKIQLEIMK
ncbi:extracellular solute-binding protein [Paenibacillus sp. Soil724D2]|uniref:extracellular solute-binding protein n=1 Tax=Paenibacillus sp. (strain Soil724D2) TaxID=1736392 RepID=UPI0007149AF0|nr:extracellular solute-binding protein [Paenibacillus sp. Soil724D2]KRE49868.1 ABC transporter substrate-binding protein [Paenibacillus sp. Soil724D2]